MGTHRALVHAIRLPRARRLGLELLEPRWLLSGAVASYRMDFRDDSPLVSGWQYLWNAPLGWDPATNSTGDMATGSIADPSSYLPMPDAGTYWTADGDTDGTNHGPDNYVRLTSTGGYPGAHAGLVTGGGTNGLSRYAIAAYTLAADGCYAIADSWLNKPSASGDSVEVRVSVNGGSPYCDSFVGPGATLQYDTYLGQLHAGDTIYVGSPRLEAAAAQVNLESVLVRDAGNLAGPGGRGAVSSVYSSRKFEVTTAQYCAFLNAMAKTDTGLWNDLLWLNIWGCKIQRGRSSGNSSYRVAEDYANRPANFVGCGEAARFANWMHNGQPTGNQGPSTTEDGAYLLNGVTTSAQLLTMQCEADWKWAIPTQDEWFRAAYYNPATNDYYLYLTSNFQTPSNNS